MDSAITASDQAPPSSLLTESQAAAILNIAPATLTSWRATKRVAGPAHCKVGGAIRYRRSDIESFIAKSVQDSAE